MKNSKLLLSILSISILCLTACGSKPSMSFEETIDTITHSELRETMSNAENYEESFNISTEFHIDEDNVDANLNLNTTNKQNTKDFQWESLISVNIEASGDGDTWRETIEIDWDAIIRYLSNAIYFKLNSLNMSGPDALIKDADLNLTWIKNQRFSLELTDEMIDELYGELPEDFDFDALNDEENLKKFTNDLKNSINNEWSIIYNGIYTEFNWYNARKFSINKEKAFMAFAEYIKWFVPEEYMEEYTKELEEIDFDEIFEDFPLKNFEWYFVITWKDRVQIVIENLDIVDSYSSIKIIGTSGKDRYELVVREDWDETFILSAKLNKSHYDISMKVEDLEIITWTITPKKSFWKISVDFDLAINFEDGNDKMSIPLKWWWSWKKISTFNIEIPKNSKNLLKDILWDDYRTSNSQWISKSNIKHKSFPSWTLSTPIIWAGIVMAALMPRMQAAQWRARDVSRKTALSQIQSAIVVSQWDKWKWPWMASWATEWIAISVISWELKAVWMNSTPVDPIENNIVTWLGRTPTTKWQYSYLVTKRNWVQNGWFVLMAKTEIGWWSNRVVCENGNWLDEWYITNDTDIASIQPCYELNKWYSCSAKSCTYTDESELRYILIY